MTEEQIREIATLPKKFSAFADATKERHADLDRRVGELHALALESAQKLARGGDDGGGYDVSNRGNGLRAMLEGSTELQAMAANKGRRAVIEMPVGYFNVKAQITSTGIVMPDQRPGIVAPTTRRLTIRSLIPSVRTDSGSVTYLQETAFSNSAAPVSEGDTKPESNLTFELKVATVVTLAHWLRCTTQVLSDLPQLQSYIDGRLRFGLAYVEELQLLSGSGVGNNLSGLLTQATAFTGSGSTRIDKLRAALTQLETANYSPTGILLHPADWATIVLLKDTTGRYIVGDPSGGNPPSLWSLPVIPTAAMPQGDFLVGDFPAAALLFDREDARVDISTETDDDFVTNRCHIRAEERLALAVIRPGALIRGDLTAS